MAISPSNNPFGNTLLVDRLIGTAYDTVKLVAENLQYVKHVSANLSHITAVSESIDATKVIEDYLDQIVAIATDIANIDNVSKSIISVNSVANQMTQLLGLYTELDNVLIAAANVATIAGVGEHISDVQVVSAKMTTIEEMLEALPQLEAVIAEKTEILQAVIDAQAARDQAQQYAEDALENSTSIVLATDAETIEGTSTAKATTPHGVKASLDAWSSGFATAAQGEKADTALQPNSEGELAYSNIPHALKIGGNIITDANLFTENGWAVGDNIDNAPTNTGPGDWYTYQNDLGAGPWGTQRATQFFSGNSYIRRIQGTGAHGSWERDYRGSELHPALNYIKSPVKLSQFLSSSPDTDAAMDAFLAALKDGGRQYDGLIDVAVNLAAPKTLENYTGTLEGTNDSYLCFTSVGNGLTIDNSDVEWYDPRTLKLFNLTILTSVGAEQTGTGLRVFGSSVQSDNLVPTLDAEGVNVMGNIPANGWNVGMEITQIKKASLRALRFRGRVPSTLNVAGCLDNATHINLMVHNGCNQVDITGLRADWARYGVAVLRYSGDTMSEGVNLYGGDIRASRIGYLAQAGEGCQFQINSTHFDVTSRGVVIGDPDNNGGHFSLVRGGFFLRSAVETLAADWMAIDYNTMHGVITDNIVWTPAHNGSGVLAVGINIGRDGISNTGQYVIVANNQLIGQDTGIVTRNTSTSVAGRNMCLAAGNTGHVSVLNTGTGNNLYGTIA